MAKVTLFRKYMIVTCQDMLDKLLKVDLPLSMSAAMEDTAKEATDQQRAQLSQGLMSDDNYLPDYSFRSVFQYGKPPGPIKLYDTGDFYRGMLLDVRQDIFILESADPKSTMLQNRYGGDIFGFGSKAQAEYVLTLKPVFVQHVQNYLK